MLGLKYGRVTCAKQTFVGNVTEGSASAIGLPEELFKEHEPQTENYASFIFLCSVSTDCPILKRSSTEAQLDNVSTHFVSSGADTTYP